MLRKILAIISALIIFLPVFMPTAIYALGDNNDGSGTQAIDPTAPPASDRKAIELGAEWHRTYDCSNTGGSSPAGGVVYMIGDSIADGTKAQLLSAFQGNQFDDAIINSHFSRTLTEGDDTELDGLSILQNDKDKITKANVVVVELGTNSKGLTDENINKAVKIIKDASPGAQIYWVNVGVDNSKRNPPALDGDGLNSIIQKNSSLGYRVIDWAAQVKEHPDYIDPNPKTGLGVHPSDAGKQPFADLVASTAAGSSSTSTASGLSCRCALGSFATTGDNKRDIWNFLVSKGLTPIQAAGVMGNIQTESAGTWDPTIVEGGGHSDTVVPGKGYGIAQWTTKGRQQHLIDFSASDPAKRPVSDLSLQLDFLYEEATTSKGLKTTSRTMWESLLQQNTVQDATWSWEDEFEQPRVHHQQARVDNANQILTEFGSTTGPASNSSSCPSAANGGFAFPVDIKFYQQNPTWFTKPHHDYPAADIPIPSGTEVFSMTGGKIIKAPTGGACGNGVEIDNGDGVLFIYCHGSDGGTLPGAKQGDTVTPGQLIMHSDNTGRSTGPHLHIGIAIGGKDVCPQTLLAGIADGNIPALNTLPNTGCFY